MSKRVMMLLAIVERDKGKKFIKELKDRNIRVNFQTVGFGTAPTEMMDIFGIGRAGKQQRRKLGIITLWIEYPIIHIQHYPFV